MNTIELGSKIKLNPRAIILTGALRERIKTSDTGQISGFVPHFVIKGCPPVEFTSQGEPNLTRQDGAAIECDFTESTPLMPNAQLSYGRPLNMVHFVFGSPSIPPNIPQMKLLREAGEILRQAQGKTVHLVALPVLSSAPYGVAQGRLYLLGIFSQDGAPIFVNPDAVNTRYLTSEFPQTQKVRQIPVGQTPASTPANQVSQASTDWYESMKQAIASVTALKGAQLHKKTLAARADQLVKSQGLSPKDALARAQKEYESIPTASNEPAQTAASAPQIASGAGKRLSQARA